MNPFSIDDYLAHYGVLRRSGRYPWGSGGPENASNRGFLGYVEDMKKKGLKDTEIAEAIGTNTSGLRAAISIATNEERLGRITQAQRLKDKGMSPTAIGQQMGINESSVRSLLEPGAADKAQVLFTTSNMLKREMEEKGKKYLDVGAGVENQLGISRSKLDSSIALLREEGYELHPVQVPQQFGSNQKTTVKVLCPPGTTYREAKANLHNIRQISEFSEDGGRTMMNIQPPLNIDSKRVAVRWGDEGGKERDGMIYVRPGVEDLSMGKAQYAQVRIAVDGTHYIKGMAVYKHDLPDGVDLVVHTDKKNTGNKLDALKEQKLESDNPFGAVVRQRLMVGPDGKERVTSALNIVGNKEGSGEEGSWDDWSRNLSSQFLSKQSPKLAEKQLAMTYEHKRQDFDDILALTNPTVRKVLLEKFADGADSSAVHLKAALLPRQRTQVILPVPTLKPNQVYAPNFNHGELVALVRYPHGGTFEIPELVVNNRHKDSQNLIGKQAKDAIGIHPKTAERLSGADFDGDFVVVIPNNNRQIKTTPALKGLEGFDPKVYKLPDDHPRMKNSTKQQQMGVVSNLITDMTIRGASPDELARAVKHSMVVIDAEKHHLNYKQSAKDHGIQALAMKYQDGKPTGGASTLISRARSEIRVPDHKVLSPAKGGPIDPKTGKILYEKEPQSFVNRHGQVVVKERVSAKLAETDDAYTLVSKDNTVIEHVYADHSNRMKALANEARKEVAQYKPPLISTSAKKTYAPEVASLNKKLSESRKNKPLERQAQIIADAYVAQVKSADPNLKGAELKKVKAQALDAARARTKSDKQKIVPTADEWKAIQAGAVSAHQLDEILKASDLDAIRALATPRTPRAMTTAKESRAKQMVKQGYTQAEIADSLGVSVSTVKTVFGDG